MKESRPDYLYRALVFFFTLFACASTFSIALAQVSAGVSLLLFIVIAVRDKHQPFFAQVKWVWIFVGLYLGWLWLSSLLGTTPLASLAITKEEWLFCIIPIGAYLFRDEITQRRIVTALAISVGLVSIYGILQYATGTSWLEFSNGKFGPVPVDEVRGNFSICLTYANFSITAACFLIGLSLAGDRPWGWRGWLYAGCGALALVATMLTLRRGPILAGLLTLAVFAIVLRSWTRWAVAGLVGALVVVMLVAPQFRDRFGAETAKDQSRQYPGSRMYIWSHSLEIVKDHPVFGVGQGNFHDAYAAKLPSDISENRKLTHAHNDFINVAVIAGIPGALFFAGIWLAVLHYLWHGCRNRGWSGSNRVVCLAAFLGSLAFALSSLTEATFADEEVRELLMLVWAIGLATWYNGVPGSGRRGEAGDQRA